MRIAFVYDRVNKFGGAERVLLTLHEIWPEAPLYTAVYDREKARWADVFKVNSSFLKYLPFTSSKHEIFPFLTPYAFESFNFDDYEVVLSVTSSDAKAISTKPHTLHICYCLTPTRYLWSAYQDYLDQPGFGVLNSLVRILLKVSTPSLRKWDAVSSARPDHFIAISKTVAQRIKSFYKKEADVIYPPVDTENFRPRSPSPGRSNFVTPSRWPNGLPEGEPRGKDYFLIVSRLVPYKKIDYAISAFNELGWKLKIIGSGIDENRLKKIAKENIEFITGGLTDEKLCWYYQNCKALIFPQEEDFGISAVEAQACGKPVVGFKEGGLGEIIVSGETGELYDSQESRALIFTLKKFAKKQYLASKCRDNAARFSKTKFQKLIKAKIEELYKDWREKD